jgi:hypothetical protein
MCDYSQYFQRVQLWQGQELIGELLRGSYLVGFVFQKGQSWDPSMIADDELVGFDLMSALDYGDVTGPPVLHPKLAIGSPPLQTYHNPPPQATLMFVYHPFF